MMYAFNGGCTPQVAGGCTEGIRIVTMSYRIYIGLGILFLGKVDILCPLEHWTMHITSKQEHTYHSVVLEETQQW